MIRILLIAMVLMVSCAVPPAVPQPEPLGKTFAEDAWKKMPLKEKISQMIMVRIRGDYYHSEHWYRNSLQKWLAEDGIGGVISFGGSIHGSYHNIRQFQNWAKYPLLVAADYERGLGQWMSGGTLFPSNMALAAAGDTALAFEQGRITALEARALGVQVTFSPVLDVNNNPDNPIINFRAYSDNPQTVSRFGNAFIKSAQDNGLMACAKHYPGHGNTATDSHSSLPTISGNREELEALELAPFKSAVENGVKMVMVGHIALPGLDGNDLPASHSYKISTEILRDEWGFDGIIITDGMEMGGLTESAWAGESAVRAVEAGADILLLPMDVQQTIEAVYTAVNSGRISENRINQSVARIWKMKAETGLLSGYIQAPFAELEAVIGKPEHQKTAGLITEKSITIVIDKNSQLPLKPEKIDSLGHLILTLDDGARGLLKPFSRDLTKTQGHVNEIFVNDPLTELGRQDILDRLEGVDHLVVSLLIRIRMDKGISTIDSTHGILLKELATANIPMVTFSFGSPYLPDYDTQETYICTYGYGSVTMRAAADALWGRKAVTGVLPVNLNHELKQGTGIQRSKRTQHWGSRMNMEFPEAWAIIDSAIENKIFPGAQVLIARQGRILTNKGFGHHTYDSGSPPVTPETIYDIASLTKVLVATPITIKLISQKKLALDQTVRQFYPQFTGGGRENVTIRHLLTHSSGLPDYYQFFLDKKIKDKQDVLDYILNVELESEPGSRYNYSDLGIILLTAIIEKVSGQTIDKLANSWLYRPLGMSSTFYNPDSALLPNIAPTEIDSLYRGQLLHGEVHDENTFLMGGVSGHAGVFSTAGDIGRYAQMLVNGGVWKGKRIFKEKQVREFTTIQNLPAGSEMALGWDTPSQSGKSIAGDYFTPGSFGHLGFTGTSLWIDLNQEIIIVLLSNRVHPSRKGKAGSKEMYGIRRGLYNAVMEQIVVKDWN